jgi:hypothetical protein
MQRAALLAVVLAALPASAQDAKAWLESQNLEAADTKAFQDMEVVVARVKGAADAAAAAERVVVLKNGKPLWQTGAKDADAGSRWTLKSVGKDLDGDGAPDLHASAFSGDAKTPCCTTHVIARLKSPVKKVASYASGNVGGGDFVEIAGRKTPVMIAADDTSANAFAPYANSYFPLMILEVSPKGRVQFARDLMQTRLPGQPPPVCNEASLTANPWLRERCGEYTGSRRVERTKQIQSRLASVKSSRAADKLKWEDYYESGVLASVSAEMNRYAYTGHGNAAFNWLETVWPGNDAIKVRFVNTLRQTLGKSQFAEDLRALAAAN